MRLAEEGLRFLSSTVDTLIVIPNQNLFKLVDKQTSLLDSFRLLSKAHGSNGRGSYVYVLDGVVIVSLKYSSQIKREI